MQVKKILKILIFILGGCWGFLVAEGDDMAAELSKERRLKTLPSLSLDSQDIKVKLGAFVAQEYNYVANIQTLRNDFNDKLSYFYSCACLILDASKGVKNYDRPAAEMLGRFSCYSYWQINSVYNIHSYESSRVKELDSVNLSSHYHRPLVPHVFVEDAFLKVNFDAIWPTTRKLPTSLKMGIFDYPLGRGVVLGIYNDGGVDTLGWDHIGFPFFRPLAHSAAGLVFDAKFNKNLTGELYFSKWNSLSGDIQDSNENVRFTRISGDRPYRGKYKDRESYVARLIYENKINKIGNVHCEPYFIYTRAPEQKLERTADASTKVSTAGCMLETKNKNWTVNVEFDGQFGHQDVHAIDRNEIALKQDSNGKVHEIYTYIYQDADLIENARVSDSLKAIVNSSANRTASRNGKTLLDGSGASINYWNSGGVKDMPTVNRIRNAYKLNIQSAALLADAAYEFSNYPFKLAGSVNYIGGDAFPYNQEKDRNYHGFITLRDTLYWGYLVKSYAALNTGYMPRPENIDTSKMLTMTDIVNKSNLRFFGAAATWFPFKDRKKAEIMFNALWFWEVGALFKWDKSGAALSQMDSTTRNVINYSQNEFGFQGWLSNEKASKMLGTEMNLIFSYSPMNPLVLYGAAFVFFPGQLYKDLDGQPSFTTIRASADPAKQHKLVFESLGHSAAYGLNFGARYEF